MAALTAARLATIRQGDDAVIRHLSVPVLAATVLYAGGLAVATAAGYAKPGATATGLKALGVVEKTVDNSTGASADKFVEIRRGTFKFANSDGDPVVQGDLLATVYIVDDQTVCHTSTGKSAAGRFMGFASDGGVFVEITGF